jgi:hypothetical protein
MIRMRIHAGAVAASGTSQYTDTRRTTAGVCTGERSLNVGLNLFELTIFVAKLAINFVVVILHSFRV